MKTIYAKHSLNRKPEFKIITTIEEENGKKIVRKRSFDESAKKHLLSLLEKYEKFKKLLPSVEVLKPKIDGDSLIFSFVNSRILLADFKALYFKNKEEQQ